MALTKPNFIFFKAKEKRQVFTKFFSVLLLLIVLGIMAKPACASSLNFTYDNPDNSDTDSFFFSYTNLSMDEVMKWREEMPNVSYIYPHPDKCFRYSAVFFPDAPNDAKPAGYYMRILPNGVSSSYMEIIDSNATPPSQDVFLVRANEWIDGGETSVIGTMDDCFQNGIYFYSGYHEIARHTTVRKYQGLGKVTVTTVVSQYLNDSDTERDYFCYGSYVEMTPEDETGNFSGWKNSKFQVNHDYNMGYNSVKPFEECASSFNPQTSPGYLTPGGDEIGGFLNTFNAFGLMSGLFGHSVSAHCNSTDFDDISWVIKCGYFTESASKSLSLAPFSEVMPLQPAVDGDDWHVLARIGIDAESGWSRVGGLIKEPSPSSEWSSYILMHN